MATTRYFQDLEGPIPGLLPCGPDLQATEGALTVLRSKGIIGQQTGISNPTLDWRKFRDTVSEHLCKTRDLRLLPYLSAAVLRLDGLEPFLSLLGTARSWLESFPLDVHPLEEADHNPRALAVANWEDPFAILEPLKQVPFAGKANAGPISLRSWWVAHGDMRVSVGEQSSNPSSAEIRQALAEIDRDSVAATLVVIETAMENAKSVERLASAKDKSQEQASLTELYRLISAIRAILSAEMERRSGNVSEVSSQQTGSGHPEPATYGVQAMIQPAAMGSIRSRADAIRALTEVQRFFVATEPSSPVPLLVERAKRLVDCDFLEVLEELLPDRVAEAKSVAGVRAENG